MTAICAHRTAGVVKGFGRRPGTEAEARAEGPASESLRGRKPRAAEMATARGLGYGDLRAGRSVERGSAHLERALAEACAPPRLVSRAAKPLRPSPPAPRSP